MADITLVASLADIENFEVWAKDADVVAFDTETTGVDPYIDTVRLFQISDENTAWCFPKEWFGLAKEVLKRHTPKTRIAHNLIFDWSMLQQDGGWEFFLDPDGMHDTMMMLKAIDPLQVAGLKLAAAYYVSPEATQGDLELKAAMKKGKWTWATVPIELEEYWVYGGLDCIWTYRLAKVLHPLVTADERIKGTYNLELDIMPTLLAMRDVGIAVDRDRCEQVHEQLKAEVTTRLKSFEDAYGFSPGSNDKLAGLLVRNGVQLTEKTKTGRWAMGKAVLEDIKHPIVEEVLTYRDVAKLNSTYTSNIMRLSERDGRLHAQINSCEARTGRMCLDMQVGLFTTEQGPVKPEDIEVGMHTLDAAGDEVRIEEVFFYDDAEIIKFRTNRNGRLPIGGTPEHRWVLHSQSKDSPTQLGTATVGSYDTVILAPDGYAPAYDPFVEDCPAPEGFGALLGYLVSDGTCVWYDKPGEGLTARLYQSERNYLDQMMPVAEPYTSSKYLRGDDHWELNLRGGQVRELLESNGIFVRRDGMHLKDNPDIVRWVSVAPLPEVRNFFRAAYLGDGSKWQRNITSQAENQRTALQIAAYRLGFSSRVIELRPGGFTTNVRMRIAFQRATLHLKNATETERTRGPVWCVRTSTGTFTAWNDDGPYLTGNSMREPNLQNVSKGKGALIRSMLVAGKGKKLISCDYSQQELRILAHLSEDDKLIEIFSDDSADPFVRIGNMIYDEPLTGKEDKRRDVVKGLSYGLAYGIGVAKFASQAGITIAESTEIRDNLYKAFPGLKGFMKDTVDKARLMTQPEGYTVYGRRVTAERDYEYKLTNYRIQGTAADMTKHALLNLWNNGFGPYMRLAVHDEIILEMDEHQAMDQEVLASIEYNMSSAAKDLFTIDFPAEAVVGDHYGELK